MSGFACSEIWAGPQSAFKTRRLVTLASICAANRMGRLPGPVEGTRGNSVAADERGVVQASVYCGFAASNTAGCDRIEVFREKGCV